MHIYCISDTCMRRHNHMLVCKHIYIYIYIYSRESIVELLNAMTKLQRQFQHLVRRRHGPAEPTRQPSADNADTIKHHGQCATQHNHLEHHSGRDVTTVLTKPNAAQHTDLARNQNMTRSVRSLNLYNPGGHTPPTSNLRKRKHSPHRSE